MLIVALTDVNIYNFIVKCNWVMFWNFLELIFNTLPELKHTKKLWLDNSSTSTFHTKFGKYCYLCIIVYLPKGTVCWLSSVKLYLKRFRKICLDLVNLLIFPLYINSIPSFCSFCWSVVQTCLQRMRTRRPHVTVQKGSTIRSLRLVWSLRWSSPLTPMQRILRQSMQP